MHAHVCVLLLLQCEEKTFGQMVGGARTCYSYELFLEICGKGEVFKEYNKGGVCVCVFVCVCLCVCACLYTPVRVLFPLQG